MTVDCGITAVEQVAAARVAGLDVVITDHHRPGEELPAYEPVYHIPLVVSEVGLGFAQERPGALGVALFE